MLRNVLIMASSGIVLFSKEYTNAVAQVTTPVTISAFYACNFRALTRCICRVLTRNVRLSA